MFGPSYNSIGRFYNDANNLPTGCISVSGAPTDCDSAMRERMGDAFADSLPRLDRWGEDLWRGEQAYQERVDSVFNLSGFAPLTGDAEYIYVEGSQRVRRQRIRRRPVRKPSNPGVPTYTEDEETNIPVQPPDPECDKRLAAIFAPGAVAAGSGYDPPGIWDGKLHWNPHLYRTLHLYYNEMGTRGAAPLGLYAPAGGGEPYDRKVFDAEGRSEASYGIHYAQLGKLKNVTLVMSHVAAFTKPGEVTERTLIGYIGGPGGDTGRYVHSHLAILDEKGRNISFYDAFCR